VTLFKRFWISREVYTALLVFRCLLFRRLSKISPHKHPNYRDGYHFPDSSNDPSFSELFQWHLEVKGVSKRHLPSRCVLILYECYFCSVHSLLFKKQSYGYATLNQVPTMTSKTNSRSKYWRWPNTIFKDQYVPWSFVSFLTFPDLFLNPDFFQGFQILQTIVVALCHQHFYRHFWDYCFVKVINYSY